MESNYPSPYNFHFDSDKQEYYFETDYQVKYKVVFSEYNEIFEIVLENEKIENVYQLVLEPVEHNGNLNTKDPRIKSTVSDIIDDFFNKIEISILYICSIEDNKAKARFRLFNSWYESSTAKDQFDKFNMEYNENGENFYSSYIINKQHPEYHKYVGAFNEAMLILSSGTE